jgi:hypothetical protein
MGVKRGSFGLFGFNYRIDDEEAVVRRKLLLLLSIPLVAAGVYCIAAPFNGTLSDPRGGAPGFLGLGILLLMPGLRGLASSPIVPPPRVRITRRGVQWGFRFFPAESIRSMSVTSTMRVREDRYRRKYYYYDWFLLLDNEEPKRPRVKLVTVRKPGMPVEVEAFALAVQRLLPARGGPAARRGRAPSPACPWPRAAAPSGNGPSPPS